MIIDREALIVRERMLHSAAMLSAGTENRLLGEVMRQRFPEIDFALIVQHIPDQGCDLFWLLIDSRRVLSVEIPQDGNATVDDVIFDVCALASYRLRRKGSRRRSLDIAIDLMKQHCDGK